MMLKKQIMLAITLLKIIDVLYTAYTEYKDIKTYGNETTTKIKIMQQLII